MYTLGIETSCDETAAAVVEDGVKVLSNVVASQVDYHRKFGGVVPEIASRKHLEYIIPVIREALSQAQIELADISLIAVTAGPGLVGSLLVGVCTAKAMAYARKIPLVAANHIEGHIYGLVADGQVLPYPSVALVVSGGHTCLYLLPQPGEYRLLGQTRDDAVGEAYDKVGKVLGLSYPGGPVIDRLAASGNPEAIPFPRPYLSKDSLDFSYSGLKTAVWYYIKQKVAPPGEEDSADIDTKGANPKVPAPGQGRAIPIPKNQLADIAASFQEAAIEVLVHKTLLAAKRNNVCTVILAGGVAANRRLKEKMTVDAQATGVEVLYPRPGLCTDNAAMIACAGYARYRRGNVADLSLNAASSWPL